MSNNQLMTGLLNISFICREHIINLNIHYEITICKSKSVKDQNFKEMWIKDLFGEYRVVIK